MVFHSHLICLKNQSKNPRIHDLFMYELNKVNYNEKNSIPLYNQNIFLQVAIWWQPINIFSWSESSSD